MIKMNELIKLSDTPKSTILYYIKEGLLPEPIKDKPNLHLYDERHVKIIEFIKYLQLNFNSSITQIKALFTHKNFDINSPYQSLLGALDMVMGADFTEIFSSDELCAKFNLTQKQLQKYVDDGFLSPRDGVFTSKEKEILQIIVNLTDTQLKIVKSYIKIAKELAIDEINLALSSIDVEQNHTNNTLKQLFDILLVLKPYIFNMQTLKTYQMERK